MVPASRSASFPLSASGFFRPRPILGAVCLAVCLAVSACTRAQAPEKPGLFPLSYAEGAVLRAGKEGLEPWEPVPSPAWEGLPAGVAPAVSAAAALDGRSAVLAVNRSGLTRLRIDPDKLAYRMDHLDGGAQFPGRSVGGLFRQKERVLCLLYRDPVFETEAPRNPPSLLLSMNMEEAEPKAVSYDMNLGAESEGLFAVFPRPEGSWTIQIRRDIPEGVESVFRSFDPETGAVERLSRADFERDLTPRLLSTAPERLRRAALALAPEGHTVVVSAALADGSRAAYTFGDGKPEETVELRGAVTEFGAALVAWNAVAVVAREGPAVSFRLPLPVEGAVYRDAIPLEGAILALWEVGLFPNIEESGAVLLPTP